MADIPYRTALIVGAGLGISASVARGLAASGLKVGLAAYSTSTGPLKVRFDQFKLTPTVPTTD